MPYSMCDESAVTSDDRQRVLKRMAAQFVGQMPLVESEQREIVKYMLELVQWEASGATLLAQVIPFVPNVG